MAPNTKGKMSGEASKQIELYAKKLNNRDRLLRILKFFYRQDGDLELYNMLSIMSGKGPIEDSEQSRVLHISDITTAY